MEAKSVEYLAKMIKKAVVNASPFVLPGREAVSGRMRIL